MQRLIAVNNNAGAFVDILASIPCVRMEISEDEGAGAVMQGLQYKTIEDSFASIYTINPGREPIIIGNIAKNFKGAGRILGYPAQNSAGGTHAADKVASVRTNTPTAETLVVKEYE